MYSIRKKILLYFSTIWLIAVSLFSIVSFFFYRQTLIDFLAMIPLNPRTFKNIGIDGKIWETYLINPESVYLQLFIEKYQVVLLILFGSGILILLASLLGLDKILTNMIQSISALLFIEKIPQQAVVIPEEFLPVASAIEDYKKQVLAMHRQNERFQSYASHELRNELAVMRGLLHEHQVMEKSILAHQTYLETTISDLLILSYVPSQLQLELIDPLLIVAEAIDALQQNKQLIFIYDEAADWQHVLAKENWLYRACYNVIENAKRYCKKNTPIIIEVELALDTIIISVINEIDDTSLIMFPKTAQGHGIGLKLAEHVLETMNGIYYYEIEKGIVTSILSFPIITQK